MTHSYISTWIRRHIWEYPVLKVQVRQNPSSFQKSGGCKDIVVPFTQLKTIPELLYLPTTIPDMHNSNVTYIQEVCGSNSGQGQVVLVEHHDSIQSSHANAEIVPHRKPVLLIFYHGHHPWMFPIFQIDILKSHFQSSHKPS
jgi:hypothetical protein